MRLTEAFLHFVGFKAPEPTPPPSLPNGGDHTLIAALHKRNVELQDELAVSRQTTELLLDDEESRTSK